MHYDNNYAANTRLRERSKIRRCRSAAKNTAAGEPEINGCGAPQKMRLRENRE